MQKNSAKIREELNNVQLTACYQQLHIRVSPTMATLKAIIAMAHFHF